MKLRGHDGAVQQISYEAAMVVAGWKNRIAPGYFEGRRVILWTPPPPPAQDLGAFYKLFQRGLTAVRFALTAAGF